MEQAQVTTPVHTHTHTHKYTHTHARTHTHTHTHTHASSLTYHWCRLSCLPFVWHFLFTVTHTHTHTTRAVCEKEKGAHIIRIHSHPSKADCYRPRDHQERHQSTMEVRCPAKQIGSLSIRIHFHFLHQKTEPIGSMHLKSNKRRKSDFVSFARIFSFFFGGGGGGISTKTAHRGQIQVNVIPYRDFLKSKFITTSSRGLP